VKALLDLEPTTYVPHLLHSPDRAFPETNCYTDLWIELLHGLGHEPMAMLAYCVSVDFEGDQWTFFKPPPADIERLYGAEIQEFVVYRPLPDHVFEQIALGRIAIVEVDGFYLPDTRGRSYREQHEKTSIAIEAIDREQQRLRYFHGRGYFELEGDDYRNALRIGREFSPDVLPPYVEFVRRDRLTPVSPADLRTVAGELLAVQVERRPRENPVRRFGERLAIDLPVLFVGDEEIYHAYAFATVRQCGAAWETAASFLRWLAAPGDPPPAATAFDSLASQCKTLLFKLARAAASRRTFDVSPAIEEMASSWDIAMEELERAEDEPS
jgi:hypothetical protein